MPALAGLLLLAPAAALAQPELDALVRGDPFSTDPIAIDPAAGLADVPGPPNEDPAEIARRGPRPPAVAARAGDALTAVSGVRELAHELHIRVSDGLARIEATMRFGNEGRHPAEVRYRLAVPESAALEALRVCEGTRCRDAIELEPDIARLAYDEAARARPSEGSAPPPIAIARLVDDERGSAVVLHAAPIPRQGELEVRLSYACPLRLHGGRVELEIPPRGHDPRAAPAIVRAESEELEFEAEGERSARPVEAWFPIRLIGRARAARALAEATSGARASVVEYPCPSGEERCARVRVTAAHTAGAPVDVVFAIDASPSTEGPTRGRTAPVLAALLAEAPPGSTVRALAFASRVEPLLESPTSPGEVEIDPLASGGYADLGPGTHLEAAWGRASRWLGEEHEGRRRLVIVIGDGGITRDQRTERTFAAAARAGVEISVLNLADRPTWPELEAGARRTAGLALALGLEAAEGHRALDPLRARVRSLFAPVALERVSIRGLSRGVVELGPLRAGEELVWQGSLGASRGRALPSVRRRARSTADAALSRALRALGGAPASALAALAHGDLAPAVEGEATCTDERGPPRRPSGVSSDDAPVALAEPRSCAPPRAASPSATANARTSLPSASILAALRERLHPAARACFRRDRRGRADYSVHVEFRLRVEDREVSAVDVEGAVSEALRACLMQCAERLEIPRFDGAILVRYPVYTSREAPPPVIELAPDVAQHLDRAIER